MELKKKPKEHILDETLSKLKLRRGKRRAYAKLPSVMTGIKEKNNPHMLDVALLSEESWADFGQNMFARIWAKSEVLPVNYYSELTNL